MRQRIEATGARLMYLPRYSPDLNPIEQAWSKVKQILRSLKARISKDDYSGFPFGILSAQ